MPQTATIKSLPAAFAMMKAMQAEDVEWGEDYRGAARQALAEILEGRMDQLIDAHLERMAELGEADRRNGCYTRWLPDATRTVRFSFASSRGRDRPRRCSRVPPRRTRLRSRKPRAG